MFCPKCGHEKPQGARSCDFCDQDLNTPSDSTITDVVRSSGFVGRQRELGELTSALGDEISGHGRPFIDLLTSVREVVGMYFGAPGSITSMKADHRTNLTARDKTDGDADLMGLR